MFEGGTGVLVTDIWTTVVWTTVVWNTAVWTTVVWITTGVHEKRIFYPLPQPGKRSFFCGHPVFLSILTINYMQHAGGLSFDSCLSFHTIWVSILSNSIVCGVIHACGP